MNRSAKKTFAAGFVVCAVFASMQQAKAAAITDVAEIASFSQIYQLNAPAFADYNGGIPAYAVNNSAQVFTTPIVRIAYYFELENSQGRTWAWASMDAFTQNLAQIGVPSNYFRQQTVSNLNVESNSAAVTTGSGIATGNLEFWSNCYSTQSTLAGVGGNNALYDINDNPNHAPNCYGSMQVHNTAAAQTVLAWNRWDGGGANDVGIGNQVGGSGHSDWTFAGNAGLYSVRNLEVWVSTGPAANNVPEPLSALLLGAGLLGIVARRKKTAACV